MRFAPSMQLLARHGNDGARGERGTDSGVPRRVRADFGVMQQIACNGPNSTTIVEPARLQPH
jgi:hypothetical protein